MKIIVSIQSSINFKDTIIITDCRLPIVSDYPLAYKLQALKLTPYRFPKLQLWINKQKQYYR